MKPKALAKKLEFIRDVNYFDVDETIAKQYIDTLSDHIKYVIEAGHQIGVPPELLNIHDDSKWLSCEFIGYAMHFKGGGAPDLFSKAWLHHIHNNPHHWQHWIFSDGYTPKDSKVENGIVKMPYLYVEEMVADWMGSEMVNTGSWDMTTWLSKNLPKVKLHSHSTEHLIRVLDSLGYPAIAYAGII